MSVLQHDFCNTYFSTMELTFVLESKSMIQITASIAHMHITRSPGEADTEWHAAFQDAWTQGVSSVLSTLYPVVYPETTFNAHRDARAVLQTLWDT